LPHEQAIKTVYQSETKIQASTAIIAMIPLRKYLVNLSPAKTALWCYFIWYLLTAFRYFDPAPSIWLNSVGISAVIGIALLLGIRDPQAKPADRWQIFRLFLTPFCVSSFSSLIKGRGFILIFPPDARELALSAGCCAAFIIVVLVFKRFGAAYRA
jgi:hypothetical protein